jgi:hypothetical protein
MITDGVERKRLVEGGEVFARMRGFGNGAEATFRKVYAGLVWL